MHSKWLEVLPWLFHVARTKAKGIERLAKTKQGCIRISVEPKCKEADDWFGGTSSMFEGFMKYEYVQPIFPGGSYVAEFEEKGTIVKVDTSAVTAMKIADCLRAQDLGVGVFSGLSYDGRQENDTENGYAEWYGAVCFKVKKRDGGDDDEWSEFCDIYVSVSGAKQKEDLQCAMYASSVIVDFFSDKSENDRFMVEIPEMPKIPDDT